MTLAGPSPKAKVNMLRPACWYQMGRGYTVGAANVVSQWQDATNNGRHALQATGTFQPVLQTDGSLLFDGSNDFMQTTFTLPQPVTIYMLMKQITFTASDCFCDGVTVNSGQILQSGSTPSISINSGSTVAANGGLALNTYGVVAAVFSGAASVLQVNKGAPATGNAGTTALAGFTLGGDGNGSNNGNMQVKEIIVFPVAHTPTQLLQVINYLSLIGGLGL